MRLVHRHRDRILVTPVQVAFVAVGRICNGKIQEKSITIHGPRDNGLTFLSSSLADILEFWVCSCSA